LTSTQSSWENGITTKIRLRRKGMGILSWIILGLIAGAIAKLILPGKDPGGIIVTIVIGIVGAIIGGYIATLL